MAFWSWSKTAASNANADSTINFAEGQAPSSLNDSARAVMARLAEYRDDIAGAIVTGGTSTAYTVSSNQVFDTLAHMNGAMIAFSPHTGNGATVTLNVDGLGAKPLRSAPSVELPTGALIQGTPYVATYNNSDGAFYLQGGASNPYGTPLGGGMVYFGSSAPNSAFAFPYGQAISRTTYATLFSLISTTFGSGDGSTTFNLPDLRGRVPAGLDNMGGSSAGRLSGFTSVGAAGGAQNQSILQTHLPALNFSVSGSVGITDTHRHGSLAGDLGYAAVNLVSSVNSISINNPGTGTPTTVVSSISLVTLNNNVSGLQTGLTDTGAISAGAVSGSAASGGNGTALTTVQPTIATNYIVRII